MSVVMGSVLFGDGRGVLLLSDRLGPGGRPERDGRVGHEGVGGGAVPVPLAWRAPHGVAGAHPAEAVLLCRDVAAAAEHLKDLAVLMDVPVRAGAGCEVDGVDGHAVGGGHGEVRVDRSGELRTGLAADAVLGGSVDELHDLSFPAWYAPSWMRTRPETSPIASTTVLLMSSA